MATRYGHATMKWLMKRGWKPAPLLDDEDFVCGDRMVIDPATNNETNVYDAAKKQRERTGEYPSFLE